MKEYKDFNKRLKLLVCKRRDLIVNTLSNIFTMRLIGNKTHGDLAEIGMAEFINQFMYDFKSIHVGKDLFRAKELEMILNETGRVLKIIEIDYKKNIMASMSWTNQWSNSSDTHKEYLFLMEKTNTSKNVRSVSVKNSRMPVMVSS